MFALMETDERSDHWFNYGGYGMPQDVAHSETDIYIPRAMYGESQWDSEARAIDWVNDHLRKGGWIK
jgi:hypothetical protein